MSKLDIGAGLKNITVNDISVSSEKAISSVVDVPDTSRHSHPFKVGDINYLFNKFGRIPKDKTIQQLPVTVRALTIRRKL